MLLPLRRIAIALAPALIAASMVSRAQVAITDHDVLVAATSLSTAETAVESATTLSIAAVPTLRYDHGDPTNDEQYTLELINRARAFPADEGVRLATTTDPYIVSNYVYYQVDTAALRREFATYPARPPLAFNARLLAAARRHTNDMVANNFQSHVGSDKSLFDKRIKEAGYNGFTWIGENIFCYGENLWHALAGFLVDWGNLELGHRHNLLNFGAGDSLATEIGIAIKHIPIPQQGHVGPYVVTHDLGNLGRRLVTGVVYNDLNGNDFYDQGEGIPNITIMPSQGDYYAITSPSGGYAIPMTRVAGSVTFTASGVGLPQPIAKELEITGPNIKLDFVPGGTTTTVTQVYPPNGSIIRPAQMRLEWTSGGPTADRYRWQLAIDAQMNSVVAEDTAASDTSTTVVDLNDGTTYYWRAAAHNENGWGTWTPVWSFRLREIPAQVQLAGPANGSTVPPGNVRFRWHRSSGTTEQYRFELATDMAMTALIRSDSALPDTSIVVTGMEIDRTHYWRVAAANEAGWGPYSDVWSVRASTSSAPSMATGPNSVSVHAEPNPAHGFVTVHLTLPASGRVALRMCTQDGRLLETLVGERLAAGDHAVVWNAGRYPSGLYLLHLIVDDAAVASGAVVNVR